MMHICGKCFYIYFFQLFSRKWNLNFSHTYCDLGKTTQLNNPVWSVVANIPNLNCKFFLQWNICHVVLVNRALAIHVQNFNKQEIVFSRHSLLQNVSTFGLGYVGLSGAATSTTKTSYKNFASSKLRARHVIKLHEAEMRKPFLRKFNCFWILLKVRAKQKWIVFSLRKITRNCSFNFYRLNWECDNKRISRFYIYR